VKCPNCGTEVSNRRAPRSPAHARRNFEQKDKAVRAAELRRAGWSLTDIAEELGYSRYDVASAAINRLIDGQGHEATEDLREKELAKLDAMEQTVIDELETPRVQVSHGHVVTERVRDPETGEVVDEPLIDRDHVLNCVDRLLRIHERKSRMLGLDFAQTEPTPQLLEVWIERYQAQIEALEGQRELRALAPPAPIVPPSKWAQPTATAARARTTKATRAPRSTAAVGAPTCKGRTPSVIRGGAGSQALVVLSLSPCCGTAYCLMAHPGDDHRQHAPACLAP
jgi:hypothetical protein